MAANKKCRYEILYKNAHDYKCRRPVWRDDDDYCIFHSENEAKAEVFNNKVEEELQDYARDCASAADEGIYLPLDFRGFIFPEDFSFHGKKFTSALFQNAKFLKSVEFSYVTFGRLADFINCQFLGETSFANTRFEIADFTGAKLLNANFKHTKFYNADFRRSTIGVISLRGAIIGNDIAFSHAKVGVLDLSSITYDGLFSFEEVDQSLSNISFPSSFAGVVLERANFTGVDLSLLSFHGAFLREVNFTRVTFGEKQRPCPWRLGSLILGRTKDSMHEEHEARKLGIVLPQLTYLWKKIRALIKRNKNYEENGNPSPLQERIERFKTAEAVYAKLKHTMEDRHARRLARRMRACELECRLHGSAGLIEKIFLFLYRFLNGFGLRWFRALVFWLACIFIFALSVYEGKTATYEKHVQKNSGIIYEEGQTEIISIEKPLDLDQAFIHSVQISSVIISPTRHIKKTDIQLIFGLSVNIRWLETLQRVLSPFLLFLFLQAFRNATRD